MADVKYFCVSDIHGFYQPLMDALASKGFDLSNKNHKVIVCGDAFDRGDDTLLVFEFLKTLQEQGRLVYVKGNHEELYFECLNELLMNRTPSSHHFHNKTVKTICMLCGQNEWIAYAPRPDDICELIKEKTAELSRFIQENTVDFFQLGNKIFVHSWIPCKPSGNDYMWNPTYSEPYSWYAKRKSSLSKKDQALYDAAWSAARWCNPFLMWKNALYPESKCIVFGHYHCSYGHSHIDMKHKEFPQVNQKNWKDSFKPWIKKNAIGIDSCVSYTKFLNCIVFDDKGELISD